MHNSGFKVYKVTTEHPAQFSKFLKHGLDDCKDSLAKGGIIVFPTETLYGLGVDISNDSAIDKIIDLKGRPGNMPIAIAVSSKKQAKSVAEISRSAENIIDRCLPKPITFLLPVKPDINPILTGGSDLIGLRFPDHAVTLAIIKKFGPITATSANLHGTENPITIQPVIAQFGDNVDIYIDSGECKYGLGSTVIDITGNTIKIIRYGACSGKELEHCIKDIRSS